MFTCAMFTCIVEIYKIYGVFRTCLCPRHSICNETFMCLLVVVIFFVKYEKNLVELLQLLVRKYLNSATFH